MKIACAAYPLDMLPDWDAYAAKLTVWTEEAAAAGADLLVYPEYAAMELATLDGPEVAADLERALHAVAGWLPEADALHAALARRLGVHILAGSAPATQDLLPGVRRPVNRARLFAPSGPLGVQDKQIMTRFETDIWGVVPGGPLRVFDTVLGRIGVLICYDAEFPLLAQALNAADILLVPSVTETLAGHNRVRIAAQARALEQQCVTALACVVGAAPWCEAVDISVGAAGVFGPPDLGFPPTGVLAQGALDRPGWTYADVDPDAISQVRQTGTVRGRHDWPLSAARAKAAANAI